MTDVEFLTPEVPGGDVEIAIDRQKLGLTGLTNADVVNALREQEQLNPRAAQRPKDAETLGQVVVKAGKDGQVIRLRDVAKIEQVRGWPLLCNLDGKPCAFLQIYHLQGANPAETTKAVQAKLAELAKHFPDGVEYRTFVGEGGGR